MAIPEPPVRNIGHIPASDGLAADEARARARLAQADDVDAMRRLAGIAARSGHAGDAERLLRGALARRPRDVLVHADLSSLLCGLGRADEALALLDRRIEAQPGSIWPLSIKSGVLTAERRTAESLPVHEQLVARAPDSTIVWMNYAHALKALGHTAQAVAAYRRSLQLDPGNGAAWWGLANLRTVPLQAEDVRAMERALPGVADPFHKVQLQFALGKALADQRRFECAFARYREANALRGSLVPYDPRATRRLVESHERSIDGPFFAKRRGSGHPSADAIFIVGMPRSGSTLVEQILASHPLVEGTGELFELEDIAASVSGRRPDGSLAAAMAELAPDALHTLGRRYLEATRRHRRSDRPRFTDKMPANWQHLALIRLILPNAKVVALRRDPVACCVSAFFTCFNRERIFPSDLQDLAQYHNDYVRMLGHVDATLPGYVHQLHYERLVEDPEAEIRRLLDYLGLDFAASCLRFHENLRPVHTASALQVRRPIDRSGLDRWRDYEPWLSPLMAGLTSPG